MSFHRFISALTAVIIAGAFGVPAKSIAQGTVWSLNAGGNGHTYELIEGQKTWTAAQADAEARGGYLATVTSYEENEFLVNVLGAHRPDNVNWYLLGGFQPLLEVNPNTNWQWVTGEPWVFSSWAVNPVEPNDYFGPASEQFLMFDEGRGKWNDVPDNWFAVGYILEKGDPVPEPSTVMLIALVIPFIGFASKARATA